MGTHRGNGFKVKIFDSALRSIAKAQMTALEKTGEALRGDLNDEQVLPFDKGKLQNEHTHVDYSNVKMGIVKIVHSTPYARRLYYHPEYNFNKKENPNARGQWWDRWLDGDKKDFAQNTYKRFFKEAADGYVK